METTETKYNFLKELDYGHEIEKAWQLADNSYVVYNNNYENNYFTIIHSNLSGYTEEGWDYDLVGSYAEPNLVEGEFAYVWDYATKTEAEAKLATLLA